MFVFWFRNYVGLAFCFCFFVLVFLKAYLTCHAIHGKSLYCPQYGKLFESVRVFVLRQTVVVLVEWVSRGGEGGGGKCTDQRGVPCAIC